MKINDLSYWYLTVLNSEIMSIEVFLVCHRSFANVVKLIVRDSTGHDNSRASKTWHGVHILVGSPKICHLPYVRYKNNYLYINHSFFD